MYKGAKVTKVPRPKQPPRVMSQQARSGRWRRRRRQGTGGWQADGGRVGQAAGTGEEDQGHDKDQAHQGCRGHEEQAEPQPVRHPAPQGRPQAHAGVDGQGVGAVGAAQLIGRGKIGDVGHQRGADGGEAQAEEEVNEQQLPGRGAHGQENGGGQGDDEADGDHEFAPHPVRQEAERKGEGPGGEEKRGVDEAHHDGPGPQVLGKERHHRDAHI